MEMSKEVYEDLLLRFAKELHQVGITEDLIQRAKSSFERTPNLAGYKNSEDVRKFYYQYDGYSIEATQTVMLEVKKRRP